MPRIPDYRMQLRNILNRRSDFSEVSKQVGVSKEDLEALLELRSHIPMPSLQRLVDARGGEIAVRPEAFDDLSRESQWPAALANLRGKPLKTRNVQIQEGYEGIETVGTNLDLVDLAKWLIERVPP